MAPGEVIATPLDAVVRAAEGQLAELARRRAARAIRACLGFETAALAAVEPLDTGGVALLRVLDPGGQLLPRRAQDEIEDWDERILSDLNTAERYGCAGLDDAGDRALRLDDGESAAVLPLEALLVDQAERLDVVRAAAEAVRDVDLDSPDGRRLDLVRIVAEGRYTAAEAEEAFAQLEAEFELAETEPPVAAIEEPATLTADAVVFGEHDGVLHVLLIERGWPPFKGRRALPGGWVDPGEQSEAAALRELEEEAGLRLDAMQLVGVYADPGRDPRGRYVSFAYTARLAHLPQPVAGDDAAAARWVPVDEALSSPVRLAFDHEEIIRAALRLTT